MTRQEHLELLNEMEMFYPFFKNSGEREEAWYRVMYKYDFNETMNNLHIAMANEKYQKEPPTAYYLVQDLTPTNEKVDFNKLVIFCPICKRAVNQNEEKKHTDRCRSIDYLVRQYKKHFGKVIEKKDLWKMSDEEFDKKYLESIKRIKDKITNEREKTLLGFVLNSPSQEIIREFLSNTDLVGGNFKET